MNNTFSARYRRAAELLPFRADFEERVLERASAGEKPRRLSPSARIPVKIRRAAEIAGLAACLVLVVCLGLAMPGWAGTSVALHVSPTGTAGMLSERGADGYILVGVLSFLLGSCVTILLYRLRRSSEKKHTRDDDEL